MTNVITCCNEYPVPVEQLWACVSDPQNLARMRPGARVEPASATIRQGAQIVVHGELAGIPGHVTVRYELVDAPRKYIDTIVKGPIKSWRHTHTFFPLGPTASRMEDRLEYELSWYQRAFATKVHDGLVREFAHRHERILEMLQGIK